MEILQQYTNNRKYIKVTLFTLDGMYKTEIFNMKDPSQLLFTSFEKDYKTELTFFQEIVKQYYI